jgi:hypothetical protein
MRSLDEIQYDVRHLRSEIDQLKRLVQQHARQIHDLESELEKVKRTAEDAESIARRPSRYPPVPFNRRLVRLLLVGAGVIAATVAFMSLRIAGGDNPNAWTTIAAALAVFAALIAAWTSSQ